MSFLNQLKDKYSVKERKVESKAKTIEELIESSFADQKAIINGEEIDKKSWRSDKGEVLIKIGVLPLFYEGKNPVTFSDISESDFKQMVDDIYSAYKSGNLSAEVEDLKKRKEESDRKNAETRKRKAEEAKMKKAME